jgi:xylose isomerase
MCKEPHDAFETFNGKELEAGKLSLTDLYSVAKEVGEPKQISGKQELLEQLINCYI